MRVAASVIPIVISEERIVSIAARSHGEPRVNPRPPERVAVVVAEIILLVKRRRKKAIHQQALVDQQLGGIDESRLLVDG
jgi:hypothetical protein